MQQTSGLSGLPTSSLQIVDAQSHTWFNGCMELRNRSGCTKNIINGWIVTVENRQERWVYHTNYNYGLLAGHYWWTVDNEPNKLTYHMENNSRLLRDNPFWWDFQNVSNVFQYDWSKVESLRYAITSDAILTGVSLYKKQSEPEKESFFSVSVGDSLIGQVSSHNTNISFNELLDGGVQEFTIANINPLVDLRDAIAFPLNLEVDFGLAEHRWWESQYSFRVEVLQKTESPSTSIPEPASTLSLLTLATFGILSKLKRKQKLFKRVITKKTFVLISAIFTT
ncbi:PEP-CTERM sorting domain-containing protein [Aerosakkonema sp. BLCC-F183]|uniref:PEP-CTERM sorting domain-containing protein n=1 Tax=Aerosakkonema sp. BLCC-F183 TaxID=3342834 RepID=UPI0035BAC66F